MEEWGGEGTKERGVQLVNPHLLSVTTLFSRETQLIELNPMQQLSKDPLLLNMYFW